MCTSVSDSSQPSGLLSWSGLAGCMDTLAMTQTRLTTIAVGSRGPKTSCCLVRLCQALWQLAARGDRMY